MQKLEAKVHELEQQQGGQFSSPKAAKKLAKAQEELKMMQSAGGDRAKFEQTKHDAKLKEKANNLHLSICTGHGTGRVGKGGFMEVVDTKLSSTL